MRRRWRHGEPDPAEEQREADDAPKSASWLAMKLELSAVVSAVYVTQVLRRPFSIGCFVTESSTANFGSLVHCGAVRGLDRRVVLRHEAAHLGVHEAAAARERL